MEKTAQRASRLRPDEPEDAESRGAIEGLGENEAVLLYQGNFCEIIRTVTMSYSEDVWNHEIGVELKGWENDDR